MKKILKKVLLIVLAAVVLTANATGFVAWRAESRCITRFAKIELGSSTRFSEAERQTAVGLVLGTFQESYNDCFLKRIYYNEAESLELAPSYIDQPQYNIYGKDPNDIIVLFSDFRTGALTDGGFERNQSYHRWTWYLIRDNAKSPWREYSHGYC